MKRIIFSLSMLLILVQNGFAEANTKYNELIKQVHRCDRAATQFSTSSSIDICLKSVSLVENYPSTNEKAKKNVLSTQYNNLGVLYQNSEHDKLNAYKYYMKSAKLGSTLAQENLDNLCRNSSWACK